MRCVGCNSRKVILDDRLGEYYCSDCGFIIEDNIVDFTDLSFLFTKDGRIRAHSLTSFLLANKGLGTPLLRKILRLFAKNLNPRYMQGPEGSIERGFRKALPSLKVVWNMLLLPPELKLSSAILYRKCIRKHLIGGRSVDGMALAAVHCACSSANIKRDISDAAKEFGIPTKLVYSYSRLIGDMTKPIRPRLYVNDYIKMGALALSLPEELSRKSERLGNMVTKGRGRIDIGKHPAVVAGAVIYKATAGSGKRISQADVAKGLGVSERSIRRMVKELSQAG